MKTKYYHFAGLDFQISMDEDLMYQNERRLAAFSVESVENPHSFYFERVDNLPKLPQNCIAEQPNFQVYSDGSRQIRYIGPVSRGGDLAYACAIHEGKKHTIQLKSDVFKERVGVHTVLETLAVEHLIAQNDGLILHCSYIDYEGSGILFTAPSGTGKSTQADLWKRYRGAEIINGDRAVIRLSDGDLYAEGIPYSGSSKYCEKAKLPLRSIVYLGQAPVTSIRRIRGYEAFLKIWEGVSVNTWDKFDMEKISFLVKNIVDIVPIYFLSCAPDESAIIALEKCWRES